MSRQCFTDGTYMPSVLMIELNAKTDDIKNFSIEDRASYVHEYTHFLQDISTTFGLTNSVMFYEKMMFLAEYAHKNNVIYNIDLNKILNADFKTQFDIFHHSEGDEYLNTNEDEDAFVITHVSKGSYFTEVTVRYEHNDMDVLYKFGGTAVLESMAHEVSRSCF